MLHFTVLGMRLLKDLCYFQMLQDYAGELSVYMNIVDVSKASAKSQTDSEYLRHFCTFKENIHNI